MTDEEIRIKVAGLMGWVQIWKRQCGHNLGAPGAFDWVGREKTGGVEYVLPNYPVDLNAIHEAVMSLPTNKRDQFDVELAVVVHGDFIRHQVIYQRFETTNATARQRCLAYLKTKGLIP